MSLQIPKQGSPSKKSKKLSSGSNGPGLSNTPGSGFAASIAGRNVTGKIL